MKILLLTGIKEELRGLFNIHSFEFDKQLRIYRSKETPDVLARTIGPGLKKKSELEKILDEFRPDVIINAGLVGILNDEDSIESGDLLKIGSVMDAESDVVFPGGPGRDTLVTVDHPIFQPWEKMDLYMHYDKARACDMEAAKLLKFIGSVESVSGRTVVIFCKVAGDKPEAYKLYENEHLIRNWKEQTMVEKFKTSLYFPGGPLHLVKLLNHKERALDSLTRHINSTITRLLILKHVPPNMHSVFIPH